MAELERWSEQQPPILGELLPELGALLDLELPVAYALLPRAGGLACEFVFAPGRDQRRLMRDMDALLATRPANLAFYDPLCPQPSQRNKLLEIAWPEQEAKAMSAVLRKNHLDHRWQIRSLVCDGPSLLAWVGGFRQDPFTARERSLLRQILPALRRRLLAERRLGASAAAASALEALLERVGGAAFLLSRRGRIDHANRAGQERLAAEGVALLERLADALRGQDAGFEVLRRSEVDRHAGFLIMEKPGQHGAGPRGLAAARRWGLTRRQSQVLALLAEGHTNQRIAAELGCSPHTVELHVSAILARAGCQSRAQLVAAVWRDSAA